MKKKYLGNLKLTKMINKKDTIKKRNKINKLANHVAYIIYCNSEIGAHVWSDYL